MSYEIQRITDKHHAKIRLILCGYSNVEIARHFNVTPQNICDLRNSALVQRELRRLRSGAEQEVINASARLYDLVEPSLDVMETAVRDGKIGQDGISAQHRLETAKFILTSTGHGPQTRGAVKIEHQHHLIGKNELSVVQQMAKARRERELEIVSGSDIEEAELVGEKVA